MPNVLPFFFISTPTHFYPLCLLSHPPSPPVHVLSASRLVPQPKPFSLLVRTQRACLPLSLPSLACAHIQPTYKSYRLQLALAEIIVLCIRRDAWAVIEQRHRESGNLCEIPDLQRARVPRSLPRGMRCRSPISCGTNHNRDTGLKPTWRAWVRLAAPVWVPVRSTVHKEHFGEIRSPIAAVQPEI